MNLVFKISEVPNIECPRCRKLHHQTLFSQAHGLNVYCRADDAERIDPNPDPSEQKEDPKAETSSTKAQKELAKCILSPIFKKS